MTALGNAPAHWRRTTIGDIAEVRLGRQRSPKNHTGEFMQPYLRAANVDWYSLRPADIQQMNFTNDEMGTYALRKDDILIVEGSGSATEVGKCALVPEKYAGHAFQNTLIRVRPNETVDPRWLMYRINADAELGGFLKLARGSGIFHLGSTRTSTWPIAVPPIAEQQATVEAIERALSRQVAVSADLERLPARLALAIASYSQSLVRLAAEKEWPETQLQELVAVGRKSAYGVLKPGPDVAGGVQIVRVGDLLPSGGVSANLKRISPDIASNYRRTKLDGGELLVSVVGTVGRVAVAPPRLSGANVARAIAVFPLEGVSSSWARLVLASPSKQQVMVGSAREVARKTLNLGDLRRVTIPVPPLEMQLSLVEAAEANLTRVFAAQQTLTSVRGRAAVLRRSILKAAFEGRLAHAAAGTLVRNLEQVPA